MFTKLIIIGISLACTAPLAMGFGLEMSALELDQDQPDTKGRFLIPINLNQAGGINTNLTLVAALLASLASGLLSLFTLVGLGILAASKMDDKDKHHGGGYSSHGSSSYRRMDLLNLDWESVSVVEVIGVLFDVWNSFDTSNFNCQKKFICEVHQNRELFGPIADDIIYYFSYLKYGQVMALPYDLAARLEEYIDAAEVGSNMHRSCGDIYDACVGSAKELVLKYSGSKDHKDDVNDALDGDQFGGFKISDTVGLFKVFQNLVGGVTDVYAKKNKKSFAHTNHI